MNIPHVTTVSAYLLLTADDVNIMSADIPLF